MINSPSQLSHTVPRLICSPDSHVSVVADHYVSLTTMPPGNESGPAVRKGAVQTQHSVMRCPNSGCRVKYFEVTVLKMNLQDTVILGLAPAPMSAVLMKKGPGFVPRSMGLSSDGFLFSSGAASGERYGQRFGAGDTIGCGYDSTTQDIFFTCNGTRLPHVRMLRNFGWDVAKCRPTVHLSIGPSSASARISVFVNLVGVTPHASPIHGFR
jgi:hypothetical protein